MFVNLYIGICHCTTCRKYIYGIPLHVAVKVICLRIGFWILLSKDLIINLFESCSCHCCCCVWMLLCNTQQQQQQQHNNNKIIKKCTEIFYGNTCMTDLSTCSTPNDTIHKVTTYIMLHRM